MMDFDVHMFTDEETGEDANTGRGQLLYPRYDGSLGLIGPATACAAVRRLTATVSTVVQRYPSTEVVVAYEADQLDAVDRTGVRIVASTPIAG